MNAIVTFLLIALVISVNCAPQGSYLPPKEGNGSGGGAVGGNGGGAIGGNGGGAIGGNGGAAAGGNAGGEQIPIVSMENKPNAGDGVYSYSYETGNGIKAQESGKGGPGEEDGTKAQGDFSYKGDDGQTYAITYTADEGGFKPEGSHLPTSPPVPEEIIRSLSMQGITLNKDGSFSGGNGGGEGGSGGGSEGGSAGYPKGGPSSGSFSPDSGYKY